MNVLLPELTGDVLVDISNLRKALQFILSTLETGQTDITGGVNMGRYLEYNFPFDIFASYLNGQIRFSTSQVVITSPATSQKGWFVSAKKVVIGASFTSQYPLCIIADEIEINYAVTFRGWTCWFGRRIPAYSTSYLHMHSHYMVFSPSYPQDPYRGLGGGGSNASTRYAPNYPGLGGGKPGYGSDYEDLSNPDTFLILYGGFPAVKSGGPGGVSNTSGQVFICIGDKVNVNANVNADGGDHSASGANAYGGGGGVIILLGRNITLGNVSISAKGGNAVSSSGYNAYGGGGGLIIAWATESFQSSATFNVSGGTASGGSDNYNGGPGTAYYGKVDFFTF
ncbi:MAG: hypothetical protein QXO44_02540 [Thermoplasmatales archaeon]